MARSAPAGREWRQFKLLAHGSLPRLMNAAVMSRDGDPWQFAIWITAIIGALPSMYAFGQLFKYSALRAAPPALVERVVTFDRMFFILYAMVTAALLAALTWEALVPDRTDQEIVGSLPVRPRTLAGARLTAALAMAVLFSAVINMPCALLFALVAAANPMVGNFAMVFIAHALATMAAALTMFAALLLLRGVAAVTLSGGAANALAGVLQLTSVAALIETFLYVPSVVPRLSRWLLDGDDLAMRLPPLWFAAMYNAIGGPARPSLYAPAAVGLVVLAVALMLVVVVYLLPASWLARRALASPSKRGGRWTSALTRAAALVFARTPAVRAIVAFALGSFTRSRRHIFVLVTYLGIAVALGAVSVVAATVRRTLVLDQPAAYLVALPLVIMFFAVLGVRTAFGIPVDIDASWPFKVCGTRVRDAAAGARGALLALAVYPVAALHGVVALLLGWQVDVAARLALFDVLSGALLVHCVTYGWNTVPFARTYSPAVETLKSRALVILVPLNLFAFRGADAQIAALRSMRATLVYVAVVAVACAVVALFSRHHSTRRGLAYEREAQGSMALLGLSEAS